MMILRRVRLFCAPLSNGVLTANADIEAAKKGIDFKLGRVPLPIKLIILFMFALHQADLRYASVVSAS